MMKNIKVKLGARSYDILIGQGILTQLKSSLVKLKLPKVAAVITNPTVHSLFGAFLEKILLKSGREVYFISVPDTEESKSSTECINLIEKLAHLDRGRGVFIIALGGGVIGDLAGFAAAVYRRGIPYIQVPTTLLAQVDSSIGGKVALDLPCGKNLIGSFYQPRLVLSEINFLATLKLAQIRQALAEVIKYAVISDQKFFTFLEKHLEQILKLDSQKLQYIVEVCSRIKARIVEEDEVDQKGQRVLLNFGHTTGHALEAASNYGPDYAHGYAVALGMLVAAEIAKELKLVSAKTMERIERLIRKAGLPTRITGLNLQDILRAQGYDKKFSGGKNRFVLPLGIGKAAVKENIPQQIIIRALKSRMSSESASLGDYE